ncbi:MAG: DUF86 domain-containing protein [Desulfosarcina sp.]|nr:DUF86 domain-containing protein [Desulfobacterales bacterium]
MSKRSDMDLIDDILISIEKIELYIKEIDYDKFTDDPKTQDAVIRNIEIIGEAVKKLSEEIRLEYSSIPWKAIAGTRDRLIHGYFGVNIDIVWDISTKDLSAIKREIQSIKRISN